MNSNPECVLSAYEFDLVAGSLGMRRAPYPLRVPSIGATMEERAELTGEVYRKLAARDLVSGDRLDDELEGLLRLLGDHEFSVDVVGVADGPLRALAAVNGRAGVLAVLADDQVRLQGFRPRALASVAVGVLAPADPGRGRGFTVRKESLEKVANDDDDFGDDPFGGDLDDRTALLRTGMSAEDVDALLELATNRRAGGQIGVSRGATRAATLVTWFDTHQGRYLMVNQGEWLSIMPADHSRIEQRVADVLSTMDFEDLLGR
ncbi:ESX secretion-associated protein EspG [Saccharopolyspora gloriosae]|uniref:ESX secretion-associated protein EspG n=1 Tax=Saccharopolyspora gloriosae TaxID=455344 RepID=UPI001FB79500|nr:ESX secretion-associated protein EspG [Saccharopolyspora gloriosae]